MGSIKRIFFIVLDSFGIGAAPDAEGFGDAGANTLGSISKSKLFNIPTLTALGLGNIDGTDCIGGCESPAAAYGRMVEKSRAKDTTAGHWELAGLISEKSFPTYPSGFPDEIISAFEEAVGRGTLCNRPYSGTEVIKDYGEKHLKTGRLIVYTSADSVFQIAAHEDIIPPEELYGYCQKARLLLDGEHRVGRVIARPFVNDGAGGFKRTANRRDFSAEPPRETVLDALLKKGLASIGVGKIRDIFAGKGIGEAIITHGNREGMEITEKLFERDFTGLAFTNLVDFDSSYGHRQDRDGYANALSEFDAWLGGALGKLREGDVLIISADHGCDPADDSTDHTREYVPLLIYGDGIKPKPLGTLNGFSSVARFISRAFKLGFEAEGGDEIFDLIV